MQISSVGNENTQFTLSDTRPLAWAKESNAWLHGFWSFDWADSYVQPVRTLVLPSTPAVCSQWSSIAMFRYAAYCA